LLADSSTLSSCRYNNGSSSCYQLCAPVSSAGAASPCAAYATATSTLVVAQAIPPSPAAAAPCLPISCLPLPPLHSCACLLSLPPFPHSTLYIPPEDRSSWDQLQAQVLYLLNLALAERPPATGQRLTLVAESFGGCLALRLAAAAPQLVEQMVLINPATCFKNSLGRCGGVWQDCVASPTCSACLYLFSRSCRPCQHPPGLCPPVPHSFPVRPPVRPCVLYLRLHATC
jgi:pimeloyl-ACP methyl ester carboxylesterase